MALCHAFPGNKTIKTGEMRLFKIAIFLLLSSVAFSQGVGIGDSEFTPDESAGLEIQYSDKGLLIPRVALTSTADASTITSPATSLLVYNTGTGGLSPTGFYYNNGTPYAPEWVLLINKDNLGENTWKPDGNAGTVSGTNFIGTTDEQDLDFRTNDEIKMRLSTNGQLEILNTGNSVFVGAGAGENDDLSDNQNIAIGNAALYNNTTHNNLVAIGDSSLFNNGLGAIYTFEAIENTAVGSKTLFSNTRGYRNTAIGFHALFSNFAGFSNSAIGTNAMYSNHSGGNNTAIGSHALYSNITGGSNTAIGNSSLNKNTSGDRNTAIGSYALRLNTTGLYNTAIGSRSFENNLTGNNNIVIGYYSASNLSTGSNNIIIGNQIYAQTNGNYQLNIGNLIYGTNVDGTGSTTSTGNIGIAVPSPTEKLDVDGLIRMRSGAAADYIITGDDNGVMSWSDPDTVFRNYAWSRKGNAGTISGTNFIGTTDNQDLILGQMIQLKHALPQKDS